MTDTADLAQLVETSLIAYAANYGTLPGAQWHATPPCDWLLTGIPDALYNGVERASYAPNQVDAQIAAALAPFAARGVPALWHLGPATPAPDLAAALPAHGLTHEEDEPAMVLDLATWHDSTPMPADLVIQLVDTDAAMRDWINVWLFPDAVPAEVRARCYAAEAGLGYAPARPLRHILGLLAGRPVACAKLFVSDGIAAVHYVVTHADVRRRGIGTAMTCAVLRMARALGLTHAVLTASDEGYPIYQRLGFHTVGTRRTFLYRPPADAKTQGD